MRICKLFILLLVFAPLALNAQIQVRLHQPPPNQLKVEHLWYLDLDNQSQTTYNVYLHAEITEVKKGLLFRANSNTFNLPQGKKRIKPKDITDVKDVWYHSKYKDFIIRTGSVPEGSYTACIYVIDTKSNQEIGQHCIHLIVRLPGQPRLISPKDGATLKEKNPLFTWTKPAPLPPGEQVTYTLRIVEVQKGQTKEEAMRSNKPLYEGKALSRPYFLYPTSAKVFDRGKEYAWQVFAITGGFEIGKSEVWQFGPIPPSPAPLPPPIAITTPNGDEVWAPGNTQTIRWTFERIRAEEIIGDIGIELFKGEIFCSYITHNAPPGTGHSGSFNWEIPLFQAYGNDYRVWVRASRHSTPSDPAYPAPTGISDVSDSTFTITSSGKLAFVSCEPDELTNSDIYVLDETGRKRLTSNSWNDNSPTWSPDWTKIAFTSNRDSGNWDIYVMNADGTNLKRLTNSPALDDYPA
ncbi:PD40 domain-containing protein, partial [candidate division WOR-3 bacterium]|nr:PD40 domain-containing protein [candidate division WOR-3 bacterium]